jgi:hypothetical protein
VPDSVRLEERFELPYLGKDVFVSLMRAGLNYDRPTRAFYVDTETNLGVVNQILKSEVGMALEIAITCVVCGSAIDCSSCPHYQDCLRENLTCLCNNCSLGRDLFSLHRAAWAARMRKLDLVSSEK